MDLNTAKAIRTALDGALPKTLEIAGVGAVTVKLGNARFDDDSVTFKLEVSDRKPGEATSIAKQMADIEGLALANEDGERIVDWRPRSRKAPVVFSKPNASGLFILSVEAARRRFPRAA